MEVRSIAHPQFPCVPHPFPHFAVLAAVSDGCSPKSQQRMRFVHSFLHEAGQLLQQSEVTHAYLHQTVHKI